MKRILEINVDDKNEGGVFSLIKNVITHCENTTMKIDICSIEKFEKERNKRIIEDTGSKIYYVGYEENKFVKQIKCFRNECVLLSNRKYDVVHIHADTANKLLVSGLAAKRIGIKRIILHSHSSGVDGNHRQVKLIFHTMCKPFLRWIGTQFVACSDLASTWMFGKRIQTQIITNGIDLNKFRYDESKRFIEREKLGIKDEILIGHVGRFEYQKNHEFLLRVFKLFCESNVEGKLLLIGKGSKMDEIQKMAKDLGIYDRVIFYGHSNNVEALLQAMDIFLLPSRFEGLPIVGVEAQAAGLPIIFSSNITLEAKLASNVKYLPIDSCYIGEWESNIEELIKRNLDRSLGYTLLKEKKFDISDTINELTKLYDYPD